MVLYSINCQIQKHLIATWLAIYEPRNWVFFISNREFCQSNEIDGGGLRLIVVAFYGVGLRLAVFYKLKMTTETRHKKNNVCVSIAILKPKKNQLSGFSNVVI